MAGIARALRHRNYRLYFTGQTVSVLGTWMQQVAMSWLAYRLTGSSFLLGLIAFCSLIPLLPFAPLGGLLADRYDKRRILLWTQSLCLLQVLVLTLLVYLGIVQPWHLVGMSLVMGFISAVDIPTRQSFVVTLVEDRADLPNAIALNSSSYNAARMIGPAVGGYVVSAWGEDICLMVNAASYFAVILSLLSMRTRQEERHHGAPLEALRQGVRYVRDHPRILELMFFIAAVSFFLMPYQVLIPYFAKQVYGGGAHTYGLLMGANGLGALAGALFLAGQKSIAGLDRRIGRATIGGSVMLVAFILSGQFWLGMANLMLLGFFIFFTLAACNTAVQSMVSDEMRGRVLSLYYVAMAGITPLGSLAGGWAAEHLGARVTLAGGALVGIIAGGIYLRRAQRRRAAKETSATGD